MKTTTAILFAMLLVEFSSGDNITGRWETQRSAKGNVTGVVFKDDGNFEGYVNNKPFGTGKYKVHDDVISFTDNGCEGKPGTYKLILFSNSDSMRFEFVSDECAGRAEGMKKTILGRVKPVKQNQ